MHHFSSLSPLLSFSSFYLPYSLICPKSFIFFFLLVCRANKFIPAPVCKPAHTNSTFCSVDETRLYLYQDSSCLDHSWRFKYHVFCSVMHLSAKAIVCSCVYTHTHTHTQPFMSSEKPTLKNTDSAFILFLIRNLKNLKSCLTGPDIPTVSTGFPMNPWGALASPSQRVTGASILTTTDVIILSHTGLGGTSYEEDSEGERFKAD